MQGQVLNLGMGGHFVGDVGARATKAGTHAFGHDRARRNPADTLLTQMVLVLAAQRAGRACCGQAVQTGSQVAGITRQQLGNRALSPRFDWVPGERGEPVRKVGQAKEHIRFPDPVRGSFGHRLEALFTRLQGSPGSHQRTVAAIDPGAGADRIACKQCQAQRDK